MDTSPVDSEVESESASINPRLRALKSADNTPIESGDDCSEQSRCKQTPNKNKTTRNYAGTPTSRPSSTVSVESEIGANSSFSASQNNQNRKRVNKRQVPTSIDTINEVVNKMSAADKVSTTASASSSVANLNKTETKSVVSNTTESVSKKGAVKKQRSEGSSDTLVDEPVTTKSQQQRQLRRSTETLTDQQDNQNKQLNSSAADSNSTDEVSANTDDQPEKWSRSKSYAHAIDI